jgi:hypothetical protein
MFSIELWKTSQSLDLERPLCSSRDLVHQEIHDVPYQRNSTKRCVAHFYVAAWNPPILIVLDTS